MSEMKTVKGCLLKIDINPELFFETVLCNIYDFYEKEDYNSWYELYCGKVDYKHFTVIKNTLYEIKTFEELDPYGFSDVNINGSTLEFMIHYYNSCSWEEVIEDKLKC